MHFKAHFHIISLVLRKMMTKGRMSALILLKEHKVAEFLLTVNTKCSVSRDIAALRNDECR